MKRIDTATAEPDLHGTGKDGFRDAGVGTSPTQLDASFFNAVQEEIAGLIEGAHTSLLTSTYVDLLRALLMYFVEYGFSKLDNAAATGADNFAAVFAEDKFVVSKLSNVYTCDSDDGTWSTFAIATAGLTFTGLAHSSTLGLFVGAGAGVGGVGGAIESSPDGETWTSRDTDADAYYGLCWDSTEAKFYAVGDNGLLKHSANGTAWTDVTPFTTDDFCACAAGGGNMVIISAAATSIWRRTASPATFTEITPGYALRAVCWDDVNEVFVAVGDAGIVYTSPTGAAWTAQSFGSSSNAVSLSSALGVTIAGTDNGTVKMSANGGVSWSKARRIAPVGDSIRFTCMGTSSTYLAGQVAWATDGENYVRWSLAAPRMLVTACGGT